MKRRFQAVRQLFTIAVGVLVLGLMTTGTARAAGCDRACLQNMMTRYLDAMVAHAPSQLPLAANVRFTEDSHDLKLGDGLWKTVTRKGGFRQDYIDVRRQIAAAHVQLFEGDRQVLYSVELRVAEGKISGIETLVFRVTPDVKFKPDRLDKPLPGMNDPVPAGKGVSRAELVRVAMTYVEGLRVGGFIKANTPFAPEAYRMENGVRTAGKGCTTSTNCVVRTQHWPAATQMQASVAVVDEEEGIVLLWMNFGGAEPAQGPDKALVTFESFKIWDGSIHAINAFLCYLPKKTERGWPTAE